MNEETETIEEEVTGDEIDSGVSDEPLRLTNDFPVAGQLSLLGLILFLLLGTAYAPKFVATFVQPDAKAETIEMFEINSSEKNIQPTIRPIEDIVIAGKSAYVWDVSEQRVLFSKNADEVLPLASITKLMTALVAYELINFDETVVIPLDAIKQEGVSGFFDGEKFTFQSLTDLTLMSSSNDGAYALAAAGGALLEDDLSKQPSAFVDAMNIKAEEIGLTNTTFLNPTGLDVSTTKSGSYSTARETTFLMEYLLEKYPEVLSATQKSHTNIFNETGSYHDAENTNVIIEDVPNLIGSKTGYTDLAGGNLVIAFDAGLNRPIIVTVLGSTRNGRFTDVKKLVEAVQMSMEVEQ